jgi:uncharacterized membrane protein YkoI
MRQSSVVIGIAAFCLAVAFAAEKPVTFRDLPPAVQKTVQAETKGSQIKGFSQEIENGKTVYEVESIMNGLGRDLLIDSAGAVIEVEQEVALDSIPAAARAVIQKKAAGGKITKVETLTKGKTVSYEAAVDKAGKTSEISVAADGSVLK